MSNEVISAFLALASVNELIVLKFINEWIIYVTNSSIPNQIQVHVN